MDKNQIANIFTYHAPVGTQTERYEKIRSAARDLANVINDAVPDSREKAVALTNLQQTTMWANAGIAINEALKAQANAKMQEAQANAANANPVPVSGTETAPAQKQQ